MKLSDPVVALKQTYCGPIGAEYMHITSTEENAGFSSASSLAVPRSVAKRKTLPQRTDRCGRHGTLRARSSRARNASRWKAVMR